MSTVSILRNELLQNTRILVAAGSISSGLYI